MKPLKQIIMVSLVIFMSVNLCAQDVLQTYIEQGVKSNLALKQENQILEQSIESLKQAQSLFFPKIDFNASYTVANGGRTIDVPIGDLLNPVYTALNQLNGMQNFPTNLQNASEPIIPNDFHDTRLEFRQPIFNSDIYFNYKANDALISVQQAKRDVYIQELKKEIKKGYYNYIQAQEVLHIYDSTKTVLKELVRINKSLVKNNTVTKDVVYRSEFELQELYSQIAQAESTKNLAKSYFNFLLNRNLDETIIIDKNLKIGSNYLFPELNILKDTAIQKREELVQVNHAIKANDFAHNLEKYNWLPKLELGAIAGYQGFGYTFDNNQDYALVQFNLSIPIFNGAKNKSKRAQSKIRVQQFQTRYQELEQQIQVQVIDAYNNLNASNEVVNAKEAAFESAKENFRIVKRKYQENLVILVEFLDARVQFTNSQIALVIAHYDVLIKQAELNRALAL